MVMRLIDLGHDEDDDNNEGQDRKRRNNRTCIGSSPITDVAAFGLRRDRRFEEGAKLSWLVGLLRMIGFRPFRRNFDRGRAGASRAGFRGFRDGVRIDGGMYLLAPGGDSRPIVGSGGGALVGTGAGSFGSAGGGAGLA